MNTGPHSPDAAGTDQSRRLFVFNGGFFTQKPLRRIASLAGFDITLGNPGPDDLVGVWGQSPTSHRGEGMSERTGASIVRFEDAWLRSLFPGRAGGSVPAGVLIDHTGVHFDASTPSDLETLLSTEPFDDTALLNRSRGAIERMIEAGLTKYTAYDPDLPAPDPGYVLVIDQTKGDASVTASKGDRNRFLEMLFVAQEEHPGARVIIKTHPETAQGFRQGYFEPEDASRDHISFCDTPISPWALFEGAIGVYTVSSQLGFEAIFAGHKPRVFGQPFYAGWGLTEDETPVTRRQRSLTRAQLFAGAMLLYPTWYDTARDRLCTYEDAAEQLIAETRCWREDRHGWTASEMRLWKRPHLQTFFGQHKALAFADIPQKDTRHMVWASKARPESDAVRVEDGFLRSKGLGAALTPPLSLVTDDLGIYYDPSRASRLETLIAERAELRPDQRTRAEALIRKLTTLGLSKYNLGQDAPALPDGHRILVPGQVEDDASILTGTSKIRTNRALLEAARAARPNAVILYKPHPDVEAGLRDGGADASDLADMVLHDVDPACLIPEVQEVWTMTSLLGFEALLRGVPVTTLGVPFYAGWGLSHDLGAVPPRRRQDVSLAGLVHATLIDYPRYFDPVSGRACPVETAIERLSMADDIPAPGKTNRLLSKLQGVFASYARFWR